MKIGTFAALAGGLAVAGVAHAQLAAIQEEANDPHDVAMPLIVPSELPPLIDDHVPGIDHPQQEINHDLHDGHTEIDDLAQLTAKSQDVFEAVLISAVPVQLPNSQATATEYTFSVTEWFKGDLANQTVTYTEIGYLDADGVGAYTCLSHKLYVGSSYLVFGRAHPQELILPFERVLQIKNDGRVVGNEAGQAVISLNNDEMSFGAERNLDPLTYDNRRIDNPTHIATSSGPPTPTDGSAVPPQPTLDAPNPKPIDGQIVIDSIRDITWAQTEASGATFDPPAGFSEPIDTADRWSSCGWTNNPYNYRGWIPGATQLNWFFTSGNDWNTLVQTGGSGGDWLIGQFNDWTELPNYGDGVNDTGYPTDAMMIAGGYGGDWAGLGNPNGIAWTWKSGCGEITQTDAFCNPSISNNELQFRKSMVHELGHNLSLAHVTAPFGIMVSGTWRVPPNYVLNSYYARLDDFLGGRNMLDFVNANVAGGTWWHETWADVCTYSQTVASSVYTMTSVSDSTLNTGQSFNVTGMHVENRGLNSLTDVQIKWYLSSNTTISSGDYQCGSGSWATYSGQQNWVNGTWGLTVPSNVPSGSYYLGWILTTPTSELSTATNTGIMRWSSGSSFAPRTVSVTCLSPSTPSTPTATDGVYCTGVNVSWPAASGAIHYDVYRNTTSSTSGMTLVGNNVASPYFDNSAVAGTTYYYRVRSNNGCGAVSGYSSYNLGHRASVPAAPASVIATNGTNCGRIIIDWSAVPGASSYTIYRGTSSLFANSSFYVSVASSFTQWTDITAPEGVWVYYWVRANGTCGAGAYASDPGYYFFSAADITTTGAGLGDPGFGVPDGEVTGADIQFYVNAWIGGNTGVADLTTTGAGVGDPGYGVPDGQITGADINFYVNLWILGCS